MIFFLKFWKLPPLNISAFEKIDVRRDMKIKDFFLFKSQNNMSDRHLSRWLGLSEHFLQFSRCLLCSEPEILKQPSIWVSLESAWKEESFEQPN